LGWKYAKQFKLSTYTSIRGLFAMADKKKMSVEEMLAAARGEKSGGASPAKSPAPKGESPAPESQTAPSTDAPAPAASKPVTPVAKGGKGMSVADMLAAARGEKGAGAKSAAPKAEAAKPAVKETPKAAPKPAAAKETTEKPAGPVVKDTASILAAARVTNKPGPVSKAEAAKSGDVKPAKTKLEVPSMPEKPAYARAAAPVAPSVDDPSRRGFLAGMLGLCAVLFQSSLAIGFTSMAATGVLWVLGFARFMFPNVLIEPPSRFKVGYADDFAPGQVQTKFIPQFGVWVVRYEYEGQAIIYAIKAVCTHLGCTPSWLEGEQKFKCPCHGSGFYKDGVNFEGPAPRPLERYAITRADDGQIEVDKSRTFQQELGQWKDPASFVTV
jgi:cytochrome b6-f complex iron-sulfur subunit